MMIKANLFNFNESFFGQSILFLFPVLAFSGSLELALTSGTFALALIYITALIFTALHPQLDKPFLFPFNVALAITAGLVVSALVFHLYPTHFQREGYLINLFFVSLLGWQRNLLYTREISSETLSSNLLPSLIWLLCMLWLSGLVREILGTGSLAFFGTKIILLPEDWRLPFLSQPVGAFFLLFLSAVLLRLSPNYYPREQEVKPLYHPVRPLGHTIAEKTSRLENLLNDTPQ